MVILDGKNIVVEYTATDDTLLQCFSEAEFQTDKNEDFWGQLNKFIFLEIPKGMTVYLRSKRPTTLAEIKLKSEND